MSAGPQAPPKPLSSDEQLDLIDSQLHDHDTGVSVGCLGAIAKTGRFDTAVLARFEALLERYRTPKYVLAKSCHRAAIVDSEAPAATRIARAAYSLAPSALRDSVMTMWCMAERHAVTCRAPLVLALLSISMGTLAAPVSLDAPFQITPPARLRAAPVARAASGNTYAYLPADLSQPLRFMITAMPAGEIRARLGALSEAQCIHLFLDELRKDHQHFFAVDMASPLEIGPAVFQRVRWTGDKGGRSLTGVLSCGELNGYYYVVNYVDAIANATGSFPAVRASLKALRPRAP